MNPFAVEARIRDLADRAATEFLSPLSEKRASPEYISKNAQRILEESGKDLTGILAKIAQDENLNPHEVARVCEEANKEVFARLYKGSDDKTFEFKVADARRVLEECNRPYEGPGDLFLPVEHPKFASSPPKGAEKTASEKLSGWAATALRPSEQQALLLQLEEEKIAQESFQELYYEAKAARNQAALDFLKIARDLVLEEGMTPSAIYGLVREAFPGSREHEKHARELLSLVALDTKAKFPEGADIVVKVARDILSQSGSQGDVPSDDLRHVDAETYEFWTKSPGTNPEDHSCAVSSAGHPVRVVNGRHALFVAIDTLVDQSNKENVFGKGLLISGDRVRSLVKNVVNWTPKTENVAI